MLLDFFCFYVAKVLKIILSFIFFFSFFSSTFFLTRNYTSYKYRLSRNDAVENGQHIEKAASAQRQRPLTSYILLLTSLLIDVDRRSLGEGDAVGPVEGVEIHLTHADAEGDGGQGAQEFAMRTGL
jgi:hypothetical protein